MKILVTTTTDRVNADVGSVEALLANPGADGVSLPEAIQATNGEPGSYTITFAKALAGRTIVVRGYGLPALTGGGVSVSGDVDGNGDPDITVRPRSTRSKSAGLVVMSSRNSVRSLTLRGFTHGVLLEVGTEPPRPRSIRDILLSDLVLTDIRDDAIALGSSPRRAAGSLNQSHAGPSLASRTSRSLATRSMPAREGSRWGPTTRWAIASSTSA